jgi:hypothetical protein
MGSALSNFEAVDAMLKGNFLGQLEVCFMSMFMSLNKILLQGSISTNLFGSMRHQVDRWKVGVSI